MAQKVQVLLLCDMEEGSTEAEETIQFGMGSTAYEIDMCGKHAEQFRSGLEPFVEHARKVGAATGGGRRRRERSAAHREKSASIRAWARDRGIEVSERGRIPASVVEEYEQTH